jgi:NADPH:quinone reductase-like Zn-dependent oxidoreductase
VVLLYRRHFEHHVLDVTVLRAEAGLEPAPPDTTPAIAFLDLTVNIAARISDYARPGAGQSVLINGAGGAVGGYAVQLAELVARIEAGVLQIEMAERRPLTNLAAIHDEAATGRLSGKTVLTPA